MSDKLLDALNEQLGDTEVNQEPDVRTYYTEGEDDGFEWPDLSAKKKLAPLPPAPIESMPAVLREMCREISRVVKVPVEVPMLAIMSVIGFCIGGNHRSKYNDAWKVGANIYGLIFQGPGERKSSVFKPLIDAVKMWIAARREDWRRKQTDNEIRAGKIEALKKRIKSGNFEDDEFSDRKKLDELEATEPEPDPNFILGEGTGGAIADRMKRCGGKLFYASADAKDALEVMLGKYTEGKSDTGLMLQAYDSETYDSARRGEGRSVTIESPYLGVCWMTQLNQIENLSNKSEIFDNGLISRFLVCVPEAMAGKRDSDGELIRKLTDESISPEVADKYAALVTSLLDDAERSHTPYDVPIDSDAKELLHDLYMNHEGMLGDEYEDCQKVAVRVPTQAFRIALIFAMCRTDTAPAITGQDAKNAITVAMYYWEQMERVMSLMSKRKMPQLVRRIIRKLKKDNTNILRTSPMLQHLGVKAEDLHDDAIKWMLDHKYCRPIEIANAPNPQGGRKPATDYEVNPTLL